MGLTGEVEMDHRKTMASQFSSTLFSGLAFFHSLLLFVSREELTALLPEDGMRNEVRQPLIPFLLQIMNNLEQLVQEFHRLC